MKKFVSLLAASAMALTISVAAYAADDIPGTIYADDDGAGVSGRAASISPFITGNVGDDNYTVGPGELFLVDRSSRVVAGVYNHLEPDKEYTFRIYLNEGTTDITLNPTYDVDTDDGVELTGEMLRGGSVRLRTKKGSSYVSSARIKSTGRGNGTVYDLVINTRAQYGTSMSDVEYIISTSGVGAKPTTSSPPAATQYDFADSQHSFEVGWLEIEDDETQVGEDGVIVMSNDRPVITKEQFQDISRSANYKNVTFEGDDGGWTFVGRTSGMASSNFYYTYDVVPELINRFPEQDYKFLSFKGGVTFPTNGEMRIDSDEIASEFTTMHTYLYRNGRLTPVATTFDSDTREIVFRTNYLGTFVMTDTEITDLSIIGEPDEGTKEPEPEPEPDDKDEGHGNPNTGAAPLMDLGMAIGMATLVTAGAISRKRK